MSVSASSLVSCFRGGQRQDVATEDVDDDEQLVVDDPFGASELPGEIHRLRTHRVCAKP